MAFFRIYPKCGAYLDSYEKCDCQDEKSSSPCEKDVKALKRESGKEKAVKAYA